jgi:hypothetical protein
LECEVFLQISLKHLKDSARVVEAHLIQEKLGVRPNLILVGFFLLKSLLKKLRLKEFA